MKKWIPVLIVFLLLASVISPALAEQPGKGQPTPTSPGSTATPVNATQQSGKGNGQHNVTSDTHVPPGQLKLGKISAPPAVSGISITPTAQATKKPPVSEAKLSLAKKVAGTRIGLVVSQLELYKKQISRSGLSAEEKAAIIAIADRNIAWYNQQNGDIQSASDMDIINALAAAADQQSAQLKVNMRKDAGVMACDELDARIATARNVATIAAGKVSSLKANGNDTTAIEGKLADYNARVAAASQYSTAARAAFESISGEANSDSGFNEGYRLIAQADQEMGKAYADLKDVYLLYFRSTR
jgi:hypothetical protein